MLPDTIVLPVGEKARHVTPRSCPAIARTASPVEASQIRSILPPSGSSREASIWAPPPVARNRPSGEKSTAEISPEWALHRRSSLPVGKSQTRTVPSPAAEAIRFPSGDTARAVKAIP